MTILISKALDQHEFWARFVKDLERAQGHVVIESAFVSSFQLDLFESALRRAIARNVTVCVFLQKPKLLNVSLDRLPSTAKSRMEEFGGCVALLKKWGAHVTLRQLDHRKLVVIDRRLHYEGTLNLLSHVDGDEHMRRFDGVLVVHEVIQKYNYDACGQCLDASREFRSRRNMGQILQLHRDRKRLSKIALATKSGIDRDRIARAEKGLTLPIAVYERLAEALDLCIFVAPLYLAPSISHLLNTRVSATQAQTESRDVALHRKMAKALVEQPER